MNDLTMTVTGWVATDPRHVVGPSGTRLTSFRLASTSRYFDRDKGVWTDGQTEWFTVRTFRNAAITVMNSIEKGQPVVVQGRFRSNVWEAEAGPRTDLLIDAVAVGHDLTRGIGTFTRATGDASLEANAATGVPGDVAAAPPVGADHAGEELSDHAHADGGDAVDSDLAEVAA